jgi:hypothetical protein
MNISGYNIYVNDAVLDALFPLTQAHSLLEGTLSQTSLAGWVFRPSRHTPFTFLFEGLEVIQTGI